MKKNVILITVALLIFACGGSPTENNNTADQSNTSASEKKSETTETDPKGIGEVKNVVLNNPLDEEMIAAGKNTYEVKCAACHKLTDQKVVGPGWAGITSRRKPEWIMNMVLNVDVMLDKDPAARELLKQCLVRMPNQNLSVGDARDVLEFMYSNDAQVK